MDVNRIVAKPKVFRRAPIWIPGVLPFVDAISVTDGREGASRHGHHHGYGRGFLGPDGGRRKNRCEKRRNRRHVLFSRVPRYGIASLVEKRKCRR
jgi:hypothetical protein